MNTNFWTQRRLAIGVCLWACSAVAGMLWLLSYKSTPGSSGIVVQAWPDLSRIPREPHRAHLTMFVHPRCPCSRASIDELARIMADAHDRLTAHVLFLDLKSARGTWEDSALCKTARAIPGVSVLADADGRERALFGAETSGHIVLHDAAGTLQFSGGITASRGHSGDNAGRTAILQALKETPATKTATFVFGCPLENH